MVLYQPNILISLGFFFLGFSLGFLSLCLFSLQESHFPAIADSIVEEEELYFVDFLKDDEYDEDGILTAVAPKVYEDGGSLDTIRERVEMYMGRYVLCGMMLWIDVD